METNVENNIIKRRDAIDMMYQMLRNGDISISKIMEIRERELVEDLRKWKLM